MVFSSIVFLHYYLPLVLIGYFALFLPVLAGWRPTLWRRASNLFLLIVSLVFYFWGENFLIWILITSSSMDYLGGLIISGAFRRGPVACLDPDGPRTRLQRFGLILSIVTNFAFLGFYKYFNFFVDSANATLTAVGLTGATWQSAPHIALPLGISFYTFQSLSYTIDVYRGDVRATRNYIDYFCYVTMFPQLVAGPIVRYRDVAAELVNRIVTRSTFASGVERFVIGLAKKVLIANNVARLADAVFAVPVDQVGAVAAWLGLLAYTLQIYFDFSAYSDMAIGLGRMLGFEFLENFNYPYIAQSVQDFWRRWHISLSTWFRDYLYVSLGGNRKSSARTYFNLVTVFFLCGLWHGAAWNFVVWGLFHGGFLVIERVGLERVLRRAPRPLRHLYTLLVVMVGWVLFRADTLTHAVGYLTAMVGLASGDVSLHPAAMFVRSDIAIALVLGCIGAAPMMPALAARLRRYVDGVSNVALGWSLRFGYGVAVVAGIVVLVVLADMQLASGAYNPFIYFRF